MIPHLARVLILTLVILTLTVACQDGANPVPDNLSDPAADAAADVAADADSDADSKPGEELSPEQMVDNPTCHFGPDPKVPAELDQHAVSGQITVYTFITPSQYKTYLEDFKKRCPNIEVTIVHESPAKLTERLLRDKLAPKADVIWGVAATNIIIMEWHDLLSPYTPANIEHIRPDFRDSNKPPYWVGFDAWMIGICVNPGLLKNQGLPFPMSWSDLVDPVYRNQIILYNPFETGTGFMMISHMLQRYGEVDGWAFLHALHRNIARYTLGQQDGKKEPCALVADGEIPIGISYALAGIDLKDKGKPIELIFPSGLSGWDMEASALVKKEQIKPAAKTFLDWAISKSAMHGYAKNYSIIARSDVDVQIPEGYPLDPARQLFDRDFLWDAANRQRILTRLEECYGKTGADDLCAVN